MVAPAKLFGGDGEDIFGVNVSSSLLKRNVADGRAIDSDVERCGCREIGDEET